MKKVWHMSLICIVLLSLFSSLALYAFAYGQQAHLMVVERYGRGGGRVILYSIPLEDDSLTNPDYKLLPFWWHTTINYWINPKNKYAFSTSAVIATITTAAETWDANTSVELFVFEGQRVEALGFEMDTTLLLGDYIQIQT